MLSLGASNASVGPHRAELTPLLKPQVAHSSQRNMYEPETLHQDAVTAANLAYERSKGLTVGQNGAIRGELDKYPDKASDVPLRLGRRQSVRFVGQNAVPSRTRSITRREAPIHRASHESSLQSSVPFPADSPLISNEDMVTALPEDFDEDHIASEPSSYRRLRKAKSMFNPSKGPSSSFAIGKTNSKGHHQRRSLQSSDATSELIRVPDPRLKRSYSFLRGVTDKLSTANSRYATHDAAIQLARDTYLQQMEQQRLKEQISLLHLARRPKMQKAFRRTVRTSSTNSYGSAIASPLSSIEVEHPAGLGSKARTISQTWREKLKRVFKRPSGFLRVPIQHLDATHAHYGDPTSTSHGSAQPFPSIPEADAPLLRRIGSSESSLHREPSVFSESLPSSSVRSLNSDEEAIQDKSRVTSWTNSTAANTVNMSNFIDRKRLSIIKEDGGPHQSSSSLRANGCANMYATFQQPVEHVGPSSEETRRMFFALRKEIDQNSRNATEDDCVSGTKSDSGLQKSQSFAIPGQRSSNWPGIRRVNTTREPTRQNQNSSSGIPSCAAIDSFNCTQAAHSKIDSQQNHEIKSGLTPQEIANVNESRISIPRHPLREVKSAFFPPSMRIERSNVSSVRHAMYAGSGDENFTTRSGYVDQQALSRGRMRNGSVAGSESVYSRSSSDPRSKAAISSLSLPESDNSGRAGTAIIITNVSSTQEPSVQASSPQRYSSANYSGNWKKFLASQVAALGSTGRLNVINDNVSVRERGHKKEDAQIDEDDVSVGTSRTPDLVAEQPLGIIQGNSMGRPRSARQMMSSSNQYPAKRVKSRRNENSPVTPFSMSLQQPFSTGNGISYSGYRECPPSVLQEKLSQASLNSRNSTNASTTKTPRFSPERAERVRRLKSSSSSTLPKTPFGAGDRAINDSRNNTGHEFEDADASPFNIHISGGKNQKLVDSFLRHRRSQMRISEESSTDPAFL